MNTGHAPASGSSATASGSAQKSSDKEAQALGDVTVGRKSTSYRELSGGGVPLLQGPGLAWLLLPEELTGA